MTKLNTQSIKKELEARGLTNLKRIKKSKDSLGQVNRLFETSSGTFLVITDKDDSQIVSIEPFKTPESNLPKCHMQNLVPFTIEELDAELKQRYGGNYDKNGLLKIFAIPQISYYAKDKKYIDDRFEQFLLIYEDKKILFDTHYQESKELIISPDHISKKELRGLFVETDFDLESPNEWVEMVIPEGSILSFISPEYSKLVCLSPDLTQGITTSGFGNEPSVVGSNKQLQKLDMRSLKDDEDVGELVDNYKKRKLSYDFVHYHM